MRSTGVTNADRRAQLSCCRHSSGGQHPADAPLGGTGGGAYARASVRADNPAEKHTCTEPPCAACARANQRQGAQGQGACKPCAFTYFRKAHPPSMEHNVCNTTAGRPHILTHTASADSPQLTAPQATHTAPTQHTATAKCNTHTALTIASQQLRRGCAELASQERAKRIQRTLCTNASDQEGGTERRCRG